MEENIETVKEWFKIRFGREADEDPYFETTWLPRFEIGTYSAMTHMDHKSLHAWIVIKAEKEGR